MQPSQGQQRLTPCLRSCWLPLVTVRKVSRRQHWHLEVVPFSAKILGLLLCTALFPLRKRHSGWRTASSLLSLVSFTSNVIKINPVRSTLNDVQFPAPHTHLSSTAEIKLQPEPSVVLGQLAQRHQHSSSLATTEPLMLPQMVPTPPGSNSSKFLSASQL